MIISNTCALSESGFDTCFVSSDRVFPWVLVGLEISFFLKAGDAVVGNRNQDKEASYVRIYDNLPGRWLICLFSVAIGARVSLGLLFVFPLDFGLP